MRRVCFAMLLCAGAGCITGSAARRDDDRIWREITRQDRWAQQALDARPGRDQLDRVRGSDFAAVGSARKELQRLLLAVDRGTWIRDTASELLREENDPRLLQEFDRAGQLRGEALQSADELADALSEAKGGLTVGDLRPGFEALRKAQASEERIAKLPLQKGAPRLAPSPLPVPRPFIAAAARAASASPESLRELDRLPPDDAAKVRARMADASRQQEEQKRSEAQPAVVQSPAGGAGGAGVAPGSTAAADSAPPPPKEMEAEEPPTTLSIANDAAAIIGKRAPKSITLREDGLFAISYDDVDYLVRPDGKLVRKEAH